MRMSRLTVLVTGVLGMGLLTGGCPLSRTSDGGGGNLLTFVGKVAGENITSITQDEVQVATDFVIDQTDAPIDPLTNEQADAVVDFIDANNLKSVDDIQRLIDNPDDIVIPPSVQDTLEALIQAAEQGAQQA